jgi:hypothetical protein
MTTFVSSFFSIQHSMLEVRCSMFIFLDPSELINFAFMGVALIDSPADRGCTGRMAGWWIWQKEAR